MKKNMLGMLVAMIVVALLAGCSTPKVVHFPDGSKTVKVKGRSVHIRTVEMGGKDYVLTVDGYNGSSIRASTEADETPEPKGSD